MTNKSISALTAATTPLSGTELVPVWDGTGIHSKILLKEITM